LSQKVSPKKWSSAFLKVCGTWEEEFVEASELQNTKRDDLE